jgi:AcrR family transcriptional regulator
VTTSAGREPVSRRDAQRNEALLIAAARELFAEHGVDVRFDEIARRAGLGTATLYRHFPTRAALVEAIFAEQVDEFLSLAQRCLDLPDAWQGFVSLLEAIFELKGNDRVLREIFVRFPPGEGRLTETRQRMREIFEQILRRAHDQGALRPDFGFPDLAVLLWSFGPVIDATAETAPTAWRRHLHWLLDGLRPAAATAQVEPALDEAQLVGAMGALRGQRFRQHGPRRPSPAPPATP